MTDLDAIGYEILDLLDEQAPSTVPSLEELAGGHLPQLGYMTDLSRFIMAMCSRRAGKTEGVDRRFLRNSLLKPGGRRFYMALTKDQARWMNWGPIWLPLCEKYAPDAHHDDTRQITTFSNGSVVRFTGSDDKRHIKTELGSALDEVCIDECQDQDGAVLAELVDKTLPPALGDRLGTLILAGVVPDVAAGFFWRAWAGGGYSNHNWSMFDNPHYGAARAQATIDDYLRTHSGMTEDDPLIERDYRGRFKFDANVNAFRYNPALHSWAPRVEEENIGPFRCRFAVAPELYLDRFIVGIDPAQAQDRFAFVVWGWNHQRKRLHQVAECVTDYGADPFESEWLRVCIALKERFGQSIQYIRDPGSSSATNDTLWTSHGIMVESAIKGPGSVKARVDRLADLMQRGNAKVMVDGELNDDLMVCRWDKKAREERKWELDKSNRSPDLCDAGTYALGLPLFSEVGAVDEAPQLTPNAAMVAQHEKYIRDLLAGRVVKPKKQSMAHLMWKGPPK